MIKNTLKVLRWITTRSLFSFMLLVLLSLTIIDADKILLGFRLRTLNFLMPPGYDYLIQLEQEPRIILKKKTMEYVRYYEKVAEYLPGQADAYSLLGFCYFHLGKPEEAMAYYQKAIEVNPRIFWFHYNMGLIHYKKKDYSKAVMFFERALASDVQTTFQFILSSGVIYGNILKQSTNRTRVLKDRLKRGYTDCFMLVVLSQYELKNYSQVQRRAMEAIQLNLQNPGFFYEYVGKALYHLKDYEKATQYLLGSIQKDPDRLEAYTYLGLSLKKSGREETSQKVFEKEKFLRKIEKKDDPPEGMFNLKIF